MALPAGLTPVVVHSSDVLAIRMLPLGPGGIAAPHPNRPKPLARFNLASMTSSDGNVNVAYTWDTLNRLSTVTDNRLGGSSNVTTYGYDTANNLVTVTYPNTLQSTFQYDSLNRMTSMTAANTAYGYTLGATGMRTNVLETSGRSVTWSFDGIYRLTGETVSGDQHYNGAVSYNLDPVGNRLSTTSTLHGISSGGFGYNADDELSGELYDANGNVTASGGKTFAYDSQNRLTSMNGGTVRIVYDGDGNRVAKTANGVTTQYLVDDLNPTGYPQVVEEIVNGAPQREYTYGLQRIDEDQVVQGAWVPSFYSYDGFGTVRQLTNSAGAVTDTWEYDAFGNVINNIGTTPNVYMYRGEAYDSDLGLYYLRTRWMNPVTGRFLSRDLVNGDIANPPTLHKYLYAGGDPVNRIDPSGKDDLEEEGGLDELSLDSEKQVKEVGEEVACQLETDAATVGLSIPPAGQVLEELVPEGKSCTAVAKTCSNANPITGYRAVSEEELQYILQNGFKPPEGGVEGKYFYWTVEQAWKLAQQIYRAGQFGIVKGTFPCTVPIEPISPATEGSGFFVPAQYLGEGTPTVLWP